MFEEHVEVFLLLSPADLNLKSNYLDNINFLINIPTLSESSVGSYEGPWLPMLVSVTAYYSAACSLSITIVHFVINMRVIHKIKWGW